MPSIISDASCLIILSKIGQLDLLQKLYGKVITTPVVAAEFGETLPEWIELKSPASRETQDLLAKRIDQGEASAIALAVEIGGSTIVLDDLKARRIADELGLEITGSIGILVKAKLRGVIPSIRPYLEMMRKTNFRYSKQIEAEALIQAGED